MLLSKMLIVRDFIIKHQEELYNLVKNKGFNDPDVLKVSQELDEKINILQRTLINS
ncbi:Spo0E family sporulation regulatory protein-aspartic acid phosphatase [Ammoniphilus sp. 3BR4]|uniref:Spo0E family sporulation regulatory protein-aspartic acid phosphatase n=1 Tax=Ammoniphilus sp. 3BR4 TaxID=3158265 RepID=UPI003467A569